MENFSLNEMPYDDLGILGITKERLLSLDKNNLTRLLSGQRTDILRFDFYYNGKRLQLDGKLLLERSSDNAVKALVVPVRKQIQNDFNLTDAEQIKLYAGKMINKTIQGKRHLLQLDRETNEIIYAKTANIKLPFDVNEKDRERLLTGKSVQIQTETGRHTVKVDLLNANRFSMDGESPAIRYVGSYFTMTDLQPEHIQKYNLKEQDLQRLLDGYRTNLIELNDGNGTKGKLGLIRNDDKTASLQVFPVKNEINNDLHLNPQEIDKLKRGETVTTEIAGKQYICQLDKDTNDLLRMQKDNVVPDNIRGYKLNENEKERFINGQSIHFPDPRTGETVTARLDLHHVRGIEIKDDTNKLRLIYMAGANAPETLEKQMPDKLDQAKFMARNLLDKKDLSNTARAAFDEHQKFYFDYHNPGVVSFIQTDQNRAEFMALFSNSQKSVIALKK